MKSPPTRNSQKGLHVAAGSTSAHELAERLVGREASERSRGRVRAVDAEALRTREATAQTSEEVQRLIDKMREANERLMVSAVQAQNLSDEARDETARAQAEIEDLIRQLQDANERLSATVAQVQTMAEEARLQEQAYRDLSGRLLQLQDEERRRLAVDLHDSTAQRLAALAMNLDVLKRTAVLDARSGWALAESRSLAEQCAREVRTLSYLLHPPLLDEAGLTSAVRWFVEGFRARCDIQVILDLDDIGRFSAPIETALFRVLQESLTNAHRHASTKTVSICLAAEVDAVVLVIQDQGHGLRDYLPPEDGTLQPPAALGVGIQGMRERIHQLDGTFDVDFADTGTTVRVTVPLGQAIP